MTTSPKQANLFGGARLQMDESIKLTAESLTKYGVAHEHWVIAWSGGKDSTCLLTLVVYLITAGLVPRPKSLTIAYADTRMELLPLWFCAQAIRDELAERGIPCLVALAPLDDRFLVYILGRGVPPSNNSTFRWCTQQIKIEPMEAAVSKVAVEAGLGRFVEEENNRGRLVQRYRGFGADRLLVLTGLRLGESAARDGRIAAACRRDDAECGQGWYQEALPDALCDKLAPILHWRVCHVWAWLKDWAPRPEYGDWSTELLADAYGGDESEEEGTRFGCVACPLLEEDRALERVIKRPAWSYLTPLRKLRPIYTRLRSPQVRLRKEGVELLKDGKTIGKNPQRMGPIVLEARRQALAEILAIQAEVNANAPSADRRVDILNPEEVARINELIAANTWPEKWTGDEPLATKLLPKVYQDGSVQPLLFSEDEL